MDAANAAPWVMLANDAREAKDTAAENAAIAMAAKASKIEGYVWSLYANVEANLPSNITPLDTYTLSIGFVGFEAILQQPSASLHCTDASMADAAIRSNCGALAELMVSKGSTFVDLAIGTGIGARAGWPAERVAALNDRTDAFKSLMVEQQNLFDPKTQWSCESIRRANAHMHDWARLGEIGAVEQELERSGKTIAESAREYRDFEEELRRGAQL